MNEQEYISMLQNNTAAANAFNAEQSQKQMDFQVAQNAKAMEFNSRQAELNRNWQEMMSNTAHQREVKDLIAAGLNPVLSAMGGSGASVGAGSAASVAGTQGSKAEADTSLNAGIAGLLSTMISGQTQRDVANINAAASMHNAELSADATKYAANSSYAGLMQQLAHMEEWPTTMFGAISSLVHGLGIGFEGLGDKLVGLFNHPTMNQGLPGLTLPGNGSSTSGSGSLRDTYHIGTGLGTELYKITNSKKLDLSKITQTIKNLTNNENYQKGR